MTNRNDSIRDRLLASEKHTPALKEKYEQEIRNMHQKKIGGFHRGVWLTTAVFSIAAGIGFLVFSIIAPPEVHFLARMGLLLGTAFSAGWAVISIKIFRRGSINLSFDQNAISGMSWVFVVFLLTLFFLIAPKDVNGVHLILFGLAMLVGTAVQFIGNLVNQSQMKTATTLLEIEYRMAEMAEMMKSPQERGPEIKP